MRAHLSCLSNLLRECQSVISKKDMCNDWFRIVCVCFVSADCLIHLDRRQRRRLPNSWSEKTHKFIFRLYRRKPWQQCGPQSGHSVSVSVGNEHHVIRNLRKFVIVVVTVTTFPTMITNTSGAQLFMPLDPHMYLSNG